MWHADTPTPSCPSSSSHARCNPHILPHACRASQSGSDPNEDSTPHERGRQMPQGEPSDVIMTHSSIAAQPARYCAWQCAQPCPRAPQGHLL